MNITIFKDITTEEVLCKLEEEGAKYKGLYVDMNNIDERRFVKKSAETINKLLKVVDRARIDKSRDFKNQVEKEAEAIKYRLEEANKPYTLLIDAHKKERDAILAEENRLKEEEKIKEEAAAKAVEEHKLMLERQEQRRINEENARLADINNVSEKRTAAKEALMGLGVNEDDAKKIVLAIHNNAIPNVYIKY